jgi:hypothetical protein
MPESPLRPGRFFSIEERDILARRYESNALGRLERNPRGEEIKAALLDYKTWLYMLMGASIYVSPVILSLPHPSADGGQICNGSVTAFGARIISGFGYNSLQSTTLLIPGGAVTCVTVTSP